MNKDELRELADEIMAMFHPNHITKVLDSDQLSNAVTQWPSDVLVKTSVTGKSEPWFGFTSVSEARAA